MSKTMTGRGGLRHGHVTWLALALLLCAHGNAAARTLGISSLADLSIEELAQISITTASRQPEPLATTPAAVQLITSNEIRRSGASLLPETLRLAPALQVARVSTNDWSITSRGFSGAPTAFGSLANKQLVMIDGRTIYSPIFGGVFWGVNNVVLEDIDRIEVISGPGASLWGANAVNGIIHVIRKHAQDTQGWYGSVTAGSRVEDYTLRYGGEVGDLGHFRIYGQRLQRDAFFADGRDDWRVNQGGFRIDLAPSERDDLTVQGDIYGGREDAVNEFGANGHNLMGIWRRSFSEESSMRLTAYYDRRAREFAFIDLEIDTWDLDFQHRFPLNRAIGITWGASYRLMRDDTTNPVTAELVPASRQMENVNGFLQGEFALVPDRLRLLLGTKVGENEFSGFEVQPSARLAWTPAERHLIWSSISRAVRMPSRFDVDLQTASVEGNPGFDSEKVLAYELGYRVQPLPNALFSITAFYNDYDDVRSFNVNPSPPPPHQFTNAFEAKSRGVELYGELDITPWWRVRGFYTHFDARFSARSPAVVPGSEVVEAVDPRHQITLHSMLDLPRNLQLDFTLRRVTSLPGSAILGLEEVPSYNALDARFGWLSGRWEVSLIGHNLNGGQRESGTQEVPRSIFVRVRAWY